MNIHHLIGLYGYAAVFGVAVLEGESALLAAGAAAHAGLLSWPLVVGLGFAGGLLGDQLVFELGHLLPIDPARFARVRAWLTRGRQDLLALASRFLYGLRLAAPVALATSGMSRRRFLALNAAGALVWAVGVTSAGWLFGAAWAHR